MLQLSIPGRPALARAHLVLDYTLAAGDLPVTLQVIPAGVCVDGGEGSTV